MFILLALACASNPLNRSNAVVPTQGDGAWARVTAISPECVDVVFELVLPRSLVKTHPGSSAALWQQAYPYILNKTFVYLFFSTNASAAIVRGCNSIVELTQNNGDVFVQCDATASPTSAPTIAPSYGPLIASECEQGWGTGYFSDTGQTFIRFCNTSVCNGLAMTGDVLETSACPPLPSEGLVQTDSECLYCRSGAGIEMMYCVDDPACNGTHRCSNNPELHNNACVPPYPDYGPMTESECRSASTERGCSNVTLPEGAVIADEQTLNGFCLVTNMTIHTIRINIYFVDGYLSLDPKTQEECANIFLLGPNNAAFLEYEEAYLGVTPGFYSPFNYMQWNNATLVCYFYVGASGGSTFVLSSLIGIPLVIDDLWAVQTVDGHVATRYCDTPVCSQVYTNGLGDVYLACPATPSEGQIRNNAYPCDYCIQNDVITMMYCPDRLTCTGTWRCPNNPTLFLNACTEAYTPGPYGPLNEDECLAMGGNTFDVTNLVDNDQIMVRYCDVPICYLTYGDEVHACPPTPDEVQVMDPDCQICWVAGETWKIEMIYCGGVTGCNSTHTCSTNNALYNDACVGAYPDYGPMNEDECIERGGTAWENATEYGLMTTRYCDIDLCNGTYVNSLLESVFGLVSIDVNEIDNVPVGIDFFLFGVWTANFSVGMPIYIEGLAEQDANQQQVGNLMNKLNGYIMVISGVENNDDDTTSIYTESGYSLFTDQPDNANYLQVLLSPLLYIPSVRSWENHYNACPPLPAEGRVRDNILPCDYCIVNGAITMMYCNTTCTGTYQCPGTPGLYENACTLYYPDAQPDYGPMNEDECLNEYGGTAWAEYNFSDTNFTYVRYCKGAPVCWETFNSCSTASLPSTASTWSNQSVPGICLVQNVQGLAPAGAYVYDLSLDECAALFASGVAGLSAHMNITQAALAVMFDVSEWPPQPFDYFEWNAQAGCAILRATLISAEPSEFIIGVPANTSNACPARPSEARVRNNAEPCSFCRDLDAPIEMMYCGNTEGCTGHYYCPHVGKPYDGPYTNACTQLYPVTPTSSPTVAPTRAPTTQLYIPECFVFDGFECSNDPALLDTTWCKQDDFYKVAQYAIHPHALSEMPASSAEVALLPNPDVVSAVVAHWLQEASVVAGVCWCATKSTAWFPYGPVAVANVSTFRTIGNTSFPHDFYYKHSTFTYYTDLSVRADALVVIENNGSSTRVLLGDPTPADCPCTYEPSTLTLFEATQCAFVCVAPFYVGDMAPLSLVRTPASNVSQCASSYFLWINQWHLIRMVHSLYWQETANTFTSTAPLQYTWIPWWNSSVDTNCVALSEGYCSLVLVPYATYNDIDGDASLLALDYAGIRTWNNSTNNILNKLVPVIYTSVSEEEGVALQAAAHMLFWTNMATYSVGNPDYMRVQCQGNKTYTLSSGSYSADVVVPVVWVDAWNRSNCTGLYGCAQLSSDECTLYPGCVFLTEHTQTSTTTTTTMPPGTLPPPVSTATLPSQLQLDKTFGWVFFVAAVAAVAMIVVTAHLHRPPPPYAL